MQKGSDESTVLTPRAAATIAARLYPDGPALRRRMMRWRPHICPMERIAEAVPAGSSVLDVGCGGGLLLGLLGATGRIRAGLGFDLSGDAIAQADAMAARLRAAAPGGPALAFHRQSAVDDWPDGSWDVVCLIDVLHHVPPAAWGEVLRRAADRTAPGGRLIVKDMCRRPRWRCAMNRLHDLAMAGQWICEPAPEEVSAALQARGMALMARERINRWWYGHDLLIYAWNA